MTSRSWIRKLFARPVTRTPCKAPARRPQLEALEDRLAPAAPVVVTGAAIIANSGTAATLKGTVNPEGSTATARFQYSTSPTFTPTLASTIGSGFSFPEGVAVDGVGDVFVADSFNNAIKEVLPNGSIRTIGFIDPTGVAVDAAGDVFVADSGNNAVKEVLPNGSILTIGSGFNDPTGVAVDAAGDVFVADFGNNAVKEVLPNGSIRTIGSGFNDPTGVAVDAAGNVFVADSGNNAVKEVLPNGSILTIGSGFNDPTGVAVDAAGDVFVADFGNQAVKEVLPNGSIRTIGSGFSIPTGVAVDAAGDVFVADTGDDRVVEVSPPTVAATPSPLTGSQPTAVSASLTGLTPNTVYYYRAVATGPGGTVADSSVQSFLTVPPPVVATAPATEVAATQATLEGTVNAEGSTATARFQYSTSPTFTPTLASTIGSGFSFPEGVAVDGVGDVFVADSGNNAVKEVLPNGSIRTIGSGFNGPVGVAVDGAGDVFVADSFNNAIKEVLPNGSIRTIGSGFNDPTGVAVDAAGDVFVADSGNNAVKEVLPNGSIRTIGSGFTDPTGVAVDAAGNVFVADFGNNAVKEVLPNGSIRTIGSGFSVPVGVAVDAAGDVFVADNGNNAVKEVLPNGSILTIGSGFTDPTGVAVDAAGDVFVADTGNSRVVEVSPPTEAATPAPLSGSEPTAVSASLTGLTPGTTYYYRTVATGPGGTVADSSVQSFTPQVATSFANLSGGSVPFGAGSVNLSGQLATTPSTPFPAGSVVTVSINGVAETAAVSPDGSFQLSYQFSQAVNDFPLGAAQSPYAITYSYTDPSGTFAPASDSSQSLTVSQVAPTVGVADAGGTYNGSAFAASATVAGVLAGVDDSPAATLEGVAPSLSYYSGTYTSVAQLAGLSPLGGAPVNAGAYTVLASFPGSADYSPAQALTTFTIAQASPTVTWAGPAAIVYGTALDSTQLDATADGPGTFAYAPAAGTVLSAGTQVLSVTFTPADTTDYTGATQTASLTVAQASPSLTVSGGSFTYDGTAHSAAATATGIGDASVSGSFTFTYNGSSAVPTGAGTYAVVAAFSSTDPNYADATGSGSLIINPATPAVTVSDAGGTYNGSAFPATAAVNGGASLEGVSPTLTYYPGNTASGTPLFAAPSNAGTYTVVAAFAGSADYTSAASAPATFTIGQAATSAVVTSSASPAPRGQLVTFTVTVSGGLPVSPTGLVQFKIDGQNVGSAVPLSASGTATCSTAALAAGAHSVAALYTGDGNFAAATAPTLTQVVLGPGVTLVGTQVFLVGGYTTNDSVQVTPVGASNNGSTGVRLQASLNGAWTTTTINQGVTGLFIIGYAGNDNIQLANSLTVNATISAGDGNDNVQAGGGNTIVTLGNGNDNVQLGNGNNTVTVGNGNDNIKAGDGNNAVMANTGAGQGHINLGNGNNTVTVADTSTGQANVNLGNGSNIVTLGNGNNDQVKVGKGNNTVTVGNGNNDQVNANDGNNIVTVGNGNDTVHVGNGNNVVVEGSGKDRVQAGNGNNLIVGGLGQHTLQVGNGSNILIDGSVQVTESGDSLAQVLSDWTADGATDAATIRARLNVTDNNSNANTLQAGHGLDWFWETWSRDHSNRKATDLLN